MADRIERATAALSPWTQDRRAALAVLAAIDVPDRVLVTRQTVTRQAWYLTNPPQALADLIRGDMSRALWIDMREAGALPLALPVESTRYLRHDDSGGRVQTTEDDGRWTWVKIELRVGCRIPGVSGG